jgi:hypothetical protein
VGLVEVGADLLILCSIEDLSSLFDDLGQSSFLGAIT